jgi:hypothetical protein
METKQTEWHSVEEAATVRPSVDFIRAVADLLETDAKDILSEMGYVPARDLVAEPAKV